MGGIRKDTKPKVILAARNGKEEELWPPTTKEDPDGTYTVGEDGPLQKFEGEDSGSEEDLEQLLPEEEQYSLIFRRSFQSTPRIKKLDQRENVFRLSVGCKERFVTLSLMEGVSLTV